MHAIQTLSDLHLEAPKSYDYFNITPVAPHLALIGDIGCVNDNGYLLFIEAQLFKFEIVYLVLGNHEPYHSSWETAKQKVRQFEKESNAKKSSNSDRGLFVFMDQTRHDISPDITVLGCTLFSHIFPEQSESVSFGLNDFYHIENWTVEQHTQAHHSDLEWLDGQVKAISESEPHRRIIILTHHSPIISPEATNPAHAQSKISSGFVTDLSEQACWTSQNVKVWVFGHTHYNCDFVDQKTGKRVVANQRGYYFSQAAGFSETMTIEL
jgi:hypothetical protein